MRKPKTLIEAVASALCSEWGFTWTPCKDCRAADVRETEEECQGRSGYCLGPVGRDGYPAGADETPTRNDFRRLARVAVRTVGKSLAAPNHG